MHRYTLKPHHRRRHRKKLRLAEYGDLGFAVKGAAPRSWGSDSEAPLIEWLRARGWVWEGEPSILDGFVTRSDGVSMVEADRARFLEWWVGQGGDGLAVGPLQERWDWIERSR